MIKSNHKRTLGSFKPPKNTMEMKTETKRSFIKPSKKMFNFNSRSYKRSEKKMLRHLDGYGRRSLKERLFPKHCGFWWKSTHNGVFGPGGYSRYEFKSGNLALVIAIITLILVIVFGIWILI